MRRFHTSNFSLGTYIVVRGKLHNLVQHSAIDSPRESPNSSIPRHRCLLLSWNHVPLLSFFRTVESQILEVNVLTAVDAVAFAQNILICYFNVSVCFYANHVGVHAKDLSVDGGPGVRIRFPWSRRYSRRAREGTRAYAHAYARTYAAHMRCYYGNQNCTVWCWVPLPP